MPFLKGTLELQPSYPQVQKSAISCSLQVGRRSPLSRELFLIGAITRVAFRESEWQPAHLVPAPELGV